MTTSIAKADPVKILLVDDRPENLLAMSATLDGLDYTIVTAKSGKEALFKVLEDDFAMIIMDVAMPIMDGFETAKIIRMREKSMHTPIIFLTAVHTSEPDMLIGYSAGAIDYILKPFSPEILKYKVSVFADLYRTRRALVNQLKSTEELNARLRALNASLQAEVKERKNAEAYVMEQAALLDMAHDAIMVIDMESRVTFWNKGAEKLYGWTADEVKGRTIRELIIKDQQSLILDALKNVFTNRDWFGEITSVTKGGEKVIVDSSWTLVPDNAGHDRIICINTDITAKKRIEQQFFRAQRMESVGRLSAGIAHDMNNILAPTVMCIEMMKENNPDPDMRESIQVIESNIQRASELMKRIMLFTRGAGGERIDICISDIVCEVAKMASETFPKTIEIKVNAPGDIRPIHGDPTQMHQVLMNLCVNSRDAMPGGGTITLSAENVDLTDDLLITNNAAKRGPYVIIKVSDNGAGIPLDVIDKIFEPFFTTKGFEKGSGLGLSIVHTIVGNHGGFIDVHSVVGEGSTFTIYLPAALKKELSRVNGNAKAEALNGSGEKILVVDDEAPIREILKASLNKRGYSVSVAENGAQALTVFEQNKGNIDLIIMDMAMPVMDGPTCISNILKIDPGARVIAISGMVDKDRVVGIEGLKDRVFLSKPFTTDKLLRTIRYVLDGNGEPQAKDSPIS